MKTAIIGFGGMGECHSIWIRKAAQAGLDIEISGIYDILDSRKQYAISLGLNVFNNVEEIFNDKNTDTVIIATPNNSHYEYAIRASKFKKNIICEKPISLNYSQAKKMYEVAIENGVVFQVHQNRRWDSDFLTAKNIYEKKLVGQVYQIESRVMGSNGLPGDWRKLKNYGGGMMLDWGVHLIDQILQIEKGKIVSLYCENSFIYGEECEDGFDLSLKFDSGLIAKIVVSTNAFRLLPRWQIYGLDGTATINDWQVNGGITRVIERIDNNLKGIHAGNGYTRTMAPRSKDSIKDLNLTIIKSEEFAFYKNFINAVKGIEKPVIKEKEVLRVFKVMETAQKSAKTNTVINEII
jgi:predicted dehydrogenase